MIDHCRILASFNEIAQARQWKALHTPQNLATALVVESAELLRLFQWQSADTPVVDREAVAMEAADVLMYLLALCESLEIDLDEAVGRKCQSNRERFLDPNHG